MFFPAEIIKAKRSGRELTEQEISFFINGYTKNEIPDYQMSALLMAIYFKGLNQTCSESFFGNLVIIVGKTVSPFLSVIFESFEIPS